MPAVDLLVATKLPLQTRVDQVIESGDVALLLGSWSLRGTGPDRQAVDPSGTVRSVVRRQPDGSWRISVDHWRTHGGSTGASTGPPGWL